MRQTKEKESTWFDSVLEVLTDEGPYSEKAGKAVLTNACKEHTQSILTTLLTEIEERIESHKRNRDKSRGFAENVYLQKIQEAKAVKALIQEHLIE